MLHYTYVRICTHTHTYIHKTDRYEQKFISRTKETAEVSMPNSVQLFEYEHVRTYAQLNIINIKEKPHYSTIEQNRINADSCFWGTETDTPTAIH